MARIRGAGQGFTLVELVIVVLVIALLVAMLLPALAKSWEAARRMDCSSRLRQIGLGIFQYEKDFACLPNAQWNAFQMLMRYFGLDGAHLTGEPGKCGPKVAPYSEIFKCPSNPFITQQETGHSLSYAPLVDSGYLDSDDDGVPDSNFTHCAWSYCRTGFDRDNDGPTQAVDHVWQMRGLSQCATDTALLVEYWSPVNRIQFKNPTPPNPPGYLVVDWGGGTVLGTISWGRAGVVTSAPITSVADVGGYVFLSAFGSEAAQTGQKKPLSLILHQGSFNVLQADGAVMPLSLKDTVAAPPRDIPWWTRAAD